MIRPVGAGYLDSDTGTFYAVPAGFEASDVYTSLLAQRGLLYRQSVPGDPYAALVGQPYDVVLRQVAGEHHLGTPTLDGHLISPGAPIAFPAVPDWVAPAALVVGAGVLAWMLTP